MNVSEIKAKTRRLTKTDSTTYSDADILIDLNLAQKRVVSLIMRYSNYINEFVSIKTFDLMAKDNVSVGEVGYNGEYPWETTVLKPFRAEVKYASGDTPKPATVTQLNQSEDTQLNPDGSLYGASPQVFYSRKSWFIRPLLEGSTDVEDGIIMWFQEMPDEITADEDIPAGNDLIHEIYPYLLAMDYYGERPEKYNQNVEKGYLNALDNLRAYYSNNSNYNHRIITPNINWK
jgi:hypothetical protein